MKSLNNDVLLLITSYLEDEELSFLSEVNKIFCHIVNTYEIIFNKIRTFPTRKTIFKNLLLSEWAIEHQYKKGQQRTLYKNAITYATETTILDSILKKFGKRYLHVELYINALRPNCIKPEQKLQWLRQHYCPYNLLLLNEKIFRISMPPEKLHLRKWIIENLVWNELQLFNIIVEGDLKVFTWVIKSVPYLDKHVFDMCAQIRGRIPMMSWAKKKNIQWTPSTATYAVIGNNKEALIWLLDNKYKFSDEAIIQTISENNVELFEWCLSNNCCLQNYNFLSELIKCKGGISIEFKNVLKPYL